MIEGIANVVNLNQDNSHTVNAQVMDKGEHTVDVVEGKVNRAEAPETFNDATASNDNADSQGPENRGADTGRIVDLLG